MAKTNGPLFSLDASGKFGGALVFSKWKGRPTVRQLVTPSNPKTNIQEYRRNSIRTSGAAQKWANQTAMIYPGAAAVDKTRLRDAAPSGQAWNGYLVKSIIGAASVNIDAADALFSGLTGPQQTAWDTAADGLTPAMPPVQWYGAGGAPSILISSGETFFMYVYGLYIAGLATVPGAVPPTYA